MCQLKASKNCYDVLDCSLIPIQLTRREFMAVGAAAILGFGVDTVVHESRDLVVEHVQVSLAHLPTAFDGVTIAQLSDFHYDRFNKHLVEKSVTITNNL